MNHWVKLATPSLATSSNIKALIRKWQAHLSLGHYNMASSSNWSTSADSCRPRFSVNQCSITLCSRSPKLVNKVADTPCWECLLFSIYPWTVFLSAISRDWGAGGLANATPEEGPPFTCLQGQDKTRKQPMRGPVIEKATSIQQWMWKTRKCWSFWWDLANFSWHKCWFNGEDLIPHLRHYVSSTTSHWLSQLQWLQPDIDYRSSVAVTYIGDIYFNNCAPAKSSNMWETVMTITGIIGALAAIVGRFCIE